MSLSTATLYLPDPHRASLGAALKAHAAVSSRHFVALRRFSMRPGCQGGHCPET